VSKTDTEDLNELAEIMETSAKEVCEDNDKCEEAPTAVRGWDEDGDESESTSEKKLRNAKMWAVYGDSYSPCEVAVNTLPAAQYTINHSNSLGVYFRKTNTNLDDLINLPDSASEEVIASIEQFWTKKEHFAKLGFLWKRGVMLWGPAGSGKTSTLQMISHNIIEKGGLSVYVENPSLAAEGLALMRKLEPVRPIVVMLEDIDAIIGQHGEASLLALLDGELQIDNVVFIATTNYPERLDKRIINRPSRFDIIKKIGMPNEAARRTYLLAKDPFWNDNNVGDDVDELNKWVKETDGFSVAHLKETIVSCRVFEVPFNDTIVRLKKMMDVQLTSEGGFEGGFGFTGKKRREK